MPPLRCPSCGAVLAPSAEACPTCGADTRVLILVGSEDAPRSGGRPRVHRVARALVAVAGAVALGAVLWALGSARNEAPPGPAPSARPATDAVRPPMQLGEQRWLCPLGWSYGAYEPEHRFYSPNHPLLPPTSVRPHRCYRTPPDALADGYFEAPPPEGTEVVDGVYLIEMSGTGYGDILESQCSAASLRLRFSVPCPSRLPNPGRDGPFPECGRTSIGGQTEPPCAWHRTFLFEYGGFAVPPGFHVLNPDNPGHLVVGAYLPNARPDDSEVPYFVQCPDARQTGTVDLRLSSWPRPLVRAVLLACRSGLPPLDQHTILRWTVEGITYQVAVQGFTETSVDLAMAVAESLVLSGTEAG